MFRKALCTILTAASGLHDHDPEATQQMILDDLRGQYEAAPANRKRELAAAVWFVKSSAWTLLWTRIKFEHGWPGGELNKAVFDELDRCLQDHFSPVLECESCLKN